MAHYSTLDSPSLGSDSLSETDDDLELHRALGGSRDSSDIAVDEDGSASQDGVSQTERLITHARAYQIEMFQESMKQNAIVVMDTGTGKTQVAVLRIKAELENTSSDKMVWFIAPTGELCRQQYETIHAQIPMVQTKLIRGEDNVDSWSESTWGPVLLNTRIVVSTPQILLDALQHTFVKMDSLALMVYDEAHRCSKNAPGSRIMREVYHLRKSQGLSVPSILGLTASPSMNAKPNDIKELEGILDSVCMSPFTYREDLIAHVHKPSFFPALYQKDVSIRRSDGIRSLQQVIQSLDVEGDPEVLRLMEQGTDRNRRKLEKCILENDTYCFKQLKTFHQRSRQILQDLGPWASDQYMQKVIVSFQEKHKSDSQSVLVSSQEKQGSEMQRAKACFQERQNSIRQWAGFNNLQFAQNAYILKALNQVRYEVPSDDNVHTNNKVETLLQQLSVDSDQVTGIIFVKERTTAKTLAELIEKHPLTRMRYERVGVMVGVSHSTKNRDIWDLARHETSSSLEDFRAGKIKLLVATNVLEEGIDVPACNLVLCFDEPDNLKSFIQRRGRARMPNSRLIVLLEQSSPSVRDWEQAEIEMKKQYENKKRLAVKLAEIEETEAGVSEEYRVESTGAFITFDDAKRHLDHFCLILRPSTYVDSQPDYITATNGSLVEPQHKTTVFLPTYIPKALRSAVSRRQWKSEATSIKDAAFQAYIALHKAGLVSDKLLPLTPEDLGQAGPRVAMVDANGLLNVWPDVARKWTSHSPLWATTIRLRDPTGCVRAQYDMVMPLEIPTLPTISAFVESDEIWQLEFDTQRPIQELGSRDETSALLELHFGHRWECKADQQVLRFVSLNGTVSKDSIGARMFNVQDMSSNPDFIIRDKSGCPFLFKALLPGKPSIEMVRRAFRAFDDIPGFVDAPENVPYLALRKWSKRGDFLHKSLRCLSGGEGSAKPYAAVYPVDWAAVDTTPWIHARFGSLIPSILHTVELKLIATALMSSLLRKLDITDTSLVLTAISAGSAREQTKYERHEFLGDSILKICATANIVANDPDWPVGYLSMSKDLVVSNTRLYKSALEKGLDRFILTKPFTGRKWRPVYIADLVQPSFDSTSEPRRFSTKTLADVVEALIGVSCVLGELPKALDCVSLLLGDISKNVPWKSLEVCRQKLFASIVSDVKLPSTLTKLEELIGYGFQKKALLIESITHASHKVSGDEKSYERLEFLGDAILDNIIVKSIFPNEHLAESDLHLLKTATVNADILGFLALEHYVEQEQVEIGTADILDDATSDSPRLGTTSFKLPLWKFMRFSNASITSEFTKVGKRHVALRGQIKEALENGTEYPWVLLAQLRVTKFYSDLVEAILGAVWVDSGNMETCAAVADRFGILRLLDRLVRDKVHLLHPKEELGRLAGDLKVKYDVQYGAESDMETSLIVQHNLHCSIYIGERCIASIVDGVSRIEVETRAAEIAVRTLKEERSAKVKDALGTTRPEDAMDVDGE